MASISTNQKSGTRRIQFILPGEKRKAIRLGRVPLRVAESVKTRIELLVVAKVTHAAIDGATAQWLADIDDALHAKLAEHGLVQPREKTCRHTLHELIDQFKEKRHDVKPQTRLVWKQAFGSLVEHFGEDRRVDTITEPDAADFEQWLVGYKRKSGNPYAKATTRKRIGVSKMLWQWAKKRGIVAENVFADLKSATVATQRRHFITQAEAAAVLEACPDAQWRLLFALARYAGLRVVSEVRPLRWGDVDWERRRIRVTSPKTEAHDGKAERIVPIFPELAPYLQEAFDQAEDGAELVITLREVRETTTTYLRKRMHEIIRKAGLTPWPRVFHNLRASRQTELSQRFPGFAVCKWMGNSAQVAEDHYLSVTDALMDQAAGSEAAHNAAQHGDASARTDRQAPSEDPVFAGVCDSVPAGAMEKVAPPGFEPGTERL